MTIKKYIFYLSFFISFCISDCNDGFSEIEGQCFHNGDLSILQKFIDNSYNSSYDLDCSDNDPYCGSPNPYMDDVDSWFWKVVDGQEYNFTNGNGIVEPLELGIQEWNDGRLVSLMCGAYIYCQLSGQIPNEINQLAQIQQLRIEYNYLSGTIPETICELDTDYLDYLAFDFSGNMLCPPYPECIDDTSSFWSQDISNCFTLGDINMDYTIDVIDVIQIVDLILSLDYNVQGDINSDFVLNISDVILLINYILNEI